MMGLPGLSGFRRCTQSPARRPVHLSQQEAHESPQRAEGRTRLEHLALEVDAIEEDLVLRRGARRRAALEVAPDRRVVALGVLHIAWPTADGRERRGIVDGDGRADRRADLLGQLLVEALGWGASRESKVSAGAQSENAWTSGAPAAPSGHCRPFRGSPDG